MNPATARFLDGPRFVACLESEGIESANLTKTEQRKFHDWKDGVRADALSETVDKLLARYGLPLSYLPDEVWSAEQSFHTRKAKPRRRRPAIPAKKRAEGVRLLTEGCSPQFVADVLNVPPTAVRTWARLNNNGGNENVGLAA